MGLSLNDLEMINFTSNWNIDKRLKGFRDGSDV
jgi:hypothetical protein